MNENEKKILETFEAIIPKLSEAGQEKLLSYGQGMLAVLTGPTDDKQTDPAA